MRFRCLVQPRGIMVDMHVISGRFKGMPLPAVNAGTRPTTDRTKEAMFSYLDSRGMFDGSRVLDLYAGTGALGIEALSRGADELICVDDAGPVVSALSRTLGVLRRSSSWNGAMTARALRRRAERFASSYCGPAFSVVFIDPPYAVPTSACESLMNDLVHGGVVGEGSVIVLERSSRSSHPRAPEGWTLADRRSYGETDVSYFIAQGDSGEV